MCRTRPTKIRMSVSQLYPKLRNMHVSMTPVQLVQNVHRFTLCGIGRHVTLLGIIPIRQESEKHGAKYGFGVMCVSLHKRSRTMMGCSVIKLWPKSHNIHKKRSFHEPLLHRPEWALLCFEHCSVALSLNDAVLYFRINRGRQNTRQIARFPCYLKFSVHWIWSQEGLLRDGTVPKFMHYDQKAKFSWQKSFNFPKYAELNLVWCSVRETCPKRFLLHYSVAVFSPWSQKHPKYDIFTVLSVPARGAATWWNCSQIHALWSKS